ncbi:MAG: hypothetical protein KAV99_06455, partial [Candidatus Latescibacteria bacterium]|nr:hypothetical protein [Candidatus Latescibacterota bacterium]
MKKIKLAMIFLVVVAFFAVVVHAQSNKQVQPKKVKQKAVSEMKIAPVSTPERSPFKDSRQGYKMVTDVLDGFGGESESDNYRIPVNSGGQSSPIGASQSTAYKIFAGYVYSVGWPNVTVISPNGGESWCVDTTYNITWYSLGIDSVMIEYTADGGTNWYTIVANTPASSGTYPWTVPNTPSTNCLVKICDIVGGLCDTSDNAFTIDTCEGECIDPIHFVFTDSTALSYAIVIDSAFLDELELEECDEIGVFDDTGGSKGLLCVGASVYHPDDLPIPLTAWKDDPLTDWKDGYTPGDTMYFKVWSKNQDREEGALAHYSIGDGHFESGVFSRLWLEAPLP